MKLLTGFPILVALATFQLYPTLASGADPDECTAPSCFSERKTCGQFTRVFPFKLVLHKGSCEITPGSEGDETVVCCKTEKGVEKHKELLALKNTARALVGASPNEYPHQIRFISTGTCGGTVYNKNWIITAAHCVRYLNKTVVEDDGSYVKDGKKQQAYVIAGLSHVANATEDDKYYIDKVIWHEEWKPLNPALGNDITLLHLSRPLNLELGKIQPMRLEPTDYVPNYGGHGYLIGYGNVHKKLGVGSDDLMEFLAPIHSDGKAFTLSFEKGGDTDAPPTNNHLAVGGEDSGVTFGQGDSGGPFICADSNRKPILCGIASFKNCEVYQVCRRPSIYQRVAPMVSWIKNHTENALQESELFFDKTMFATKIPQAEVPSYLVRIGGGKKVCTGTLITQKLIVTSAECLAANGGLGNFRGKIYHIQSGLYLEKGSSWLDKDKFERDVSKDILSITKQPFHNYDIAVLALRTPIDVPVVLPKLPPKGYVITGEAKEYTFNDKSNFVESRDFVPVGDEDCAKRFSGLDSNFKLKKEHLCMRQVYSPETVCERDVGGPLICDGNYFCGFKSFHACKYPGVPEVFSSNLRGYIRNTVEAWMSQ